ncbi:MAG: hypothetical protein V2I33_22005 [Kangiellaceae bacterium]|nr:hypothetical protein [Kangiellaceae bacterium]
MITLESPVTEYLPQVVPSNTKTVLFASESNALESLLRTLKQMGLEEEVSVLKPGMTTEERNANFYDF